MQLKQKIYENEAILNVSSKNEFSRVVREIFPSILQAEERKKFLALDRGCAGRVYFAYSFRGRGREKIRPRPHAIKTGFLWENVLTDS